ncbi:Asparagine synthetase [glutamine-hydrolyzing] [Psidium guajava]|nr:Asparagine synthetase [glutamine-hydrolyzing] [Psidium guajava]
MATDASIPSQLQHRQIQQENSMRSRYVKECFKRVEDMFRFHGAAAGIDMTGHPSIPSWSSFQQHAQEQQLSSEDNADD